MRPLPPFKARPVSHKQVAKTPMPVASGHAPGESIASQIKAPRRTVRASMQLQPVQPKVLRTD